MIIQNLRIVFTYESEYIIEDLDGSFTSNPGKIVPYSKILPTDCHNTTQISMSAIQPVWCAENTPIRKFGLFETSESLFGSDIKITTKYGSQMLPWRQLRFSHPKGWIGFLLGDGNNFHYNVTPVHTLLRCTRVNNLRKRIIFPSNRK